MCIVCVRIMEPQGWLAAPLSPPRKAPVFQCGPCSRRLPGDSPAGGIELVERHQGAVLERSPAAVQTVFTEDVNIHPP